jgi:hypothetical protein
MEAAMFARLLFVVAVCIEAGVALDVTSEAVEFNAHSRSLLAGNGRIS